MAYLKPLGCAVLIVHHSGHGQKERGRGSSAIKAALDAEFSVTKNESGITLACTKAKDFDACKPFAFALKPIKLDWAHDDGSPMTGVYLEHLGEARPAEKKRKLSAREGAILTSLSEALAQHGMEPTDEIKAKFGGFDGLANKNKKIVLIEHWRELAYKAIAVDAKPGEDKTDSKKKAFQRCRNTLFNNKFTVEHGDYAWRIFER